MLMQSTINWKMLLLIPNQKITFYAVAAQENTKYKVLVFYKSKNDCNWCLTQKSIFFKAKIKCSVVYYKTKKITKQIVPILPLMFFIY